MDIWAPVPKFPLDFPILETFPNSRWHYWCGVVIGLRNETYLIAPELVCLIG